MLLDLLATGRTSTTSLGQSKRTKVGSVPPQVAVARLAHELKRKGGTTSAIARRLDTSRRQIDRLIAIAEAGDRYLARLADGEPAHKLADEIHERTRECGSAEDEIHG